MVLQQFRMVLDDMPSGSQIDDLLRLADEPTAEVDPSDGVGIVWFDRYAARLADAVVSAVHDVERIGLHPVRVEAQDWVTIEDVASRIGRAPEIVRAWASGESGPGCFPAALWPVDGGVAPLYSWLDVLCWLRSEAEVAGLPPDEEPILTAASLAIRLRHWAPQVEGMEAIRSLYDAED